MGTTSNKILNQKSLQQERDELQFQITMMAQNNENMKYELSYLREKLYEKLTGAWKIVRRLARKRKDIESILEELETILGSYCAHLDLVIADLETECELDWKLFISGEFKNINDFIDNFVYHRKDCYMYRIKKDRLQKDLDNMDRYPVQLIHRKDH